MTRVRLEIHKIDRAKDFNGDASWCIAGLKMSRIIKL